MRLDAAWPGLDVDEHPELFAGALVTDGRAGAPAAGREFEVVVFDDAVGLREIEGLGAPRGCSEAGADVRIATDRSKLQRVAGACRPGAAGEADGGVDRGAKRDEGIDREIGDCDASVEVGIPGGERLAPLIGCLELRACAGCEEAGLARRNLSGGHAFRRDRGAHRDRPDARARRLRRGGNRASTLAVEDDDRSGILVGGRQLAEAVVTCCAVEVEVELGHIGDGMIEDGEAGWTGDNAAEVTGSDEHDVGLDARLVQHHLHERGRVFAVAELALEDVDGAIGLESVDAELEPDIADVADDEVVDRGDLVCRGLLACDQLGDCGPHLVGEGELFPNE